MNYEYINYRINKKLLNEQFEICYIVDINYINELKQVLGYEEFRKLKIKEIFGKYMHESIDKLINNNTFFEEIKNELSKTNFLESLYSVDKTKIKNIKNQLIDIKKIFLKKII